MTPGHPENFITPGIETTTGPLGQGIATAVGMAMAEKMLAAEFGKKAVNHFTYVLASDGDLMEGVSQEAIAMAGHWKLNKLIVLFDDNGISIDGPLSLADSVDQVKRFQAAGWRAERIDGHNPEAIAAAIARAQKSGKPSLIACKTIIGFGAPKKAGTSKAHGEALGPDELKAAKENLGIALEPFSVPADVLKSWRDAGSRGAAAHREWNAVMATLSNRKRAEFDRRLKHERPASLAKALRAHKKALLETPQHIATRKSSELAIEAIVPAMPEFLAGSADLTGSNNTKAKSRDCLRRQDPEGPLHPLRHSRARHGCGHERHRAAWRLCAERRDLPGVRRLCPAGDAAVGPDGNRRRLCDDPRLDRSRRRRPDPSACRTSRKLCVRIPNMQVFRPCDSVEVAECWELALNRTDGPSVLALTRQNLPQLRTDVNVNRSAAGAYELVGTAGGEAQVTIFATGSEVEIAVGAHKLLAEKGIARARRLGAVHGYLPRSAEGRAGQDHRQSPGPRRGGSSRAPGLGRRHRPGRRVCRHDRLRRQRSLQASLRTFRHYCESRGRGGAGAAIRNVRNLRRAQTLRSRR